MPALHAYRETQALFVCVCVHEKALLLLLYVHLLFFFLGGYLLQLYRPNGISSMGNLGCFSWGKPAVTVELPNLWCMLGVLVFP